MTTTTSPPANLPANSEIYPSPFPARSKTASATINGVLTDVSCMYFADRILVTICQGGRLGQWIQIPLTSASPTSFDTAIPLPSSTSTLTSISNGANMILPLEHLTPRTLLGAAGKERGLLICMRVRLGV
ncbi:89321010-db96-4749-84f0-b60b21ba616a [Sclerotinia trifoliorum]|uniref:89321010-db96-4749-84f0-b60b21ba616a n=1 Tax=Sclerotinia trifoliorum TaxID=28548 RepID=A0A8H2VUL9_9HELO|nr:89321010-db96-4749-84f0-b60b21ba616a [Sclerotinia trifoliorum]